MFFLLFLARKHHHITYEKTAREGIKEESDSQGRGNNNIYIVYVGNCSNLIWTC